MAMPSLSFNDDDFDIFIADEPLQFWCLIRRLKTKIKSCIDDTQNFCFNPSNNT